MRIILATSIHMETKHWLQDAELVNAANLQVGELQSILVDVFIVESAVFIISFTVDKRKSVLMI